MQSVLRSEASSTADLRVLSHGRTLHTLLVTGSVSALNATAVASASLVTTRPRTTARRSGPAHTRAATRMAATSKVVTLTTTVDPVDLLSSGCSTATSVPLRPKVSNFPLTFLAPALQDPSGAPLRVRRSPALRGGNCHATT
jgi:hypothetical protein